MMTYCDVTCEISIATRCLNCILWLRLIHCADMLRDVADKEWRYEMPYKN
jgi:hypothetical protein